MPEVLAFRNQYINVIVGVESNYDLGFEMLKKYNESDETIINELIAELGGFEEIAKGYLDKYNHEMQKNDRNV